MGRRAYFKLRRGACTRAQLAVWDSNLHTPCGYRWEPLPSSCGEEPVPQRSEGMGFEPTYPLWVQVGTSTIIVRRGACPPTKRGDGIRTHDGDEPHNGFRDCPIQPRWSIPCPVKTLHAWEHTHLKAQLRRIIWMN